MIRQVPARVQPGTVSRVRRRNVLIFRLIECRFQKGNLIFISRLHKSSERIFANQYGCTNHKVCLGDFFVGFVCAFRVNESCFKDGDGDGVNDNKNDDAKGKK